MASQCEDLVYCVEDDYLHEKKAISSMLAAYRYFTLRHSSLPVLIFPFDCPFRYEQGKEELTQIFYDGVRYWRSVQKTTNTLLTHSSVIQRHFTTFETLALKYPAQMEDDTINKLYFNHQNGNGSIAAFNPIPSLAYHLSYQEPTSINTEHLNWRSLWDITE